MVTQRKRIKAGDVLELKAKGNFAYLHYIGKHPDYGDAVLVSPQLHEHQMAVTDDIFLNGYITFYPATAAAAQQLVDVVGHLPPPTLPRRLRRPGAIVGHRISTWIIEDGIREVVKAMLSEEELRLPIASIWNHEYLVQRITEGWNPTQEGCIS